jgi:plastocyanin
MHSWRGTQSGRAVASLLLASLLLAASILNGGRHAQATPGSPQQTAPATGAIEGRVLFEGDPIPKSTEIENGTDPEVCGRRQSFGDLIISPQNRGIQNVILSLADESVPPTPKLAADKLVIDNHNCQFSPHVAVLTTGSTVEATNSDAIFHTTHLYYGALSRNLALSRGDRLTQLVSRPGMILVKCDIHGWMKAYVRVDRHPFHAVSDASGHFAIRGLPAGRYVLEVWHETLGRQRVPVTVTLGKTEQIEIQFKK